GRLRQNASGRSRKTVLRNYMSKRCRTVVGTGTFLYRPHTGLLGCNCGQRVPGHVAEWLRSGLQNRLPRFNSGRGLQPSLLRKPRLGEPFICEPFIGRCEGCGAAVPAKAAAERLTHLHAFKADAALL